MPRKIFLENVITMKAGKIAAILVLSVAIAIVIFKLTAGKEGYSPWSNFDFTSPPLPILRPGYVGSFPGAVLPTMRSDQPFEYTTSAWEWTRV
jgi:hypothetical protein